MKASVGSARQQGMDMVGLRENESDFLMRRQSKQADRTSFPPY